jgi:hypothetical protein
MKRFLLGFLLCLSSLGFSQNLYDIRWNSDGTDYYGFMVFFTEDHVYMRIGYYGEDGEYNLVNTDYEYSVDAEDGSVITMVATNSEFVQNNNDDEWDPEHLFWYKDEASGEFVGPYIIADSDLQAENYDHIIEPEFVEVDMTQLDAEYLQFFYYTDEHDYQVLLSAGQDYVEESGSDEVASFTDTSTDGANETTTDETTTDEDWTEEDQQNADAVAGYDNTTTTANGSGGSFKIHLIAVANTAISDIGQSVAVDMNNILAEVTGITEVLGVPMDKTLITDKQFTKKNVENFIYGFNPAPNDVVIFLYSGHGYRFSNQTEKFPQLDMRYSEYMEIDDEHTMNLKQVYDELVKKGARLNIVLGDCCNSDVGFSKSMGSTFMNSRSSVDPDVNKLRALFLNSSGGIVAAGASKGQYSWCTANGGFFTCSFIGALREEISKFKTDDQPDWGDVMTGTVSATRKKSDLCDGCDPQDVVYDKFIKEG